MTIPLNKPFMTGKEFWCISQAHANGHLAGDGSFTKKCSAWLEVCIGCEIDAIMAVPPQIRSAGHRGCCSGGGHVQLQAFAAQVQTIETEQ